MRVSRKFQATITLRDDHAEKTLVLDVLPGFGRHILQLVRDLPVMDQCTGLLYLVVHERLFFRRQRRHRVGKQLVPVRVAAKQLSIPPHGASLKRLALGIGHLRQDFFVGSENRPADQPSPQGTNADQHGKANENDSDGQ